MGVGQIFQSLVRTGSLEKQDIFPSQPLWLNELTPKKKLLKDWPVGISLVQAEGCGRFDPFYIDKRNQQLLHSDNWGGGF